MAHEIEARDNVVLSRTGAWHGLGVVLPETFTPRQGLEYIGGGAKVVKRELAPVNDDGSMGDIIGDKVGLYYDDAPRELLGIVGRGYVPVQNDELADFCEALAKEGDVVKCETAGTIRNRAKVWFLLRGESFSVRKEDEVAPYILVSNGHDGWTPMRCIPTSVRVVCSNTLHMVIPDGIGNGRVRTAGCAIRHTKHSADRIDQARKALGLYQEALSGTRQILDTLGARDVNSEALKAFWASCYVEEVGDIPLEAKNGHDEGKIIRAQSAMAAMFMRFEREKELAGTTAWNAFNAFTGWAQHDKPTREKNSDAARLSRTESTLFGERADVTHRALMRAVKMLAS